MCEHCKSQKIESVGMENGRKQRCQWNEYFRRQQPYQPDTTKVMAADCCQLATQRVRKRRPLAHLCEVHKYYSMNEYQLIKELEPELNECREYLPIQSMGFRCEAIMQVKDLKDGEQLLQEIIDQLPAKTTKVIIAHRLNTIANADEIFFVNAGEVTQAGSMEHAVDMLLHGKRDS